MTTRSPASASNRDGYADRIVTHAPEWHWLVVLDMMLNNLATGLFLVAATAELLRPEIFRTVSAWAYPVSLILLLGDLLCLVFDLGDPLRFHHMLRVFKPSSPMSLGTWSLTAFSLPLTILVALEFLGLIGILPARASWMRWAHDITVVVGIIPAFASVAYKGVLFSTTAQPGWKDARWFGAYLFNSAIMLGAAEMLAIASVVGQSATIQVLRVAVGILVVLNLVPFGMMVWELLPALRLVASRRRVIGIAMGMIVVGVVVPVAAMGVGGGSITDGLALVAIVAAGLVVRWVLGLAAASGPSCLNPELPRDLLKDPVLRQAIG